MNRKNFITTIGVAAGGALSGFKKPGSILPANNQFLLPSNDEDLWNVIRQEFGFPEGYVYLNTGGIGSVPRHVRSFFNDAWAQLEMNPTPGHDLKKWEDIKKDIIPFIGEGVDISEIALISSATEGINIILNGLPLQKGDEIITTTHEHVALNIPLLNLIKRHGVIVRYFDPDTEDGLNNVKKINDLITKKTRLVFISHRTTTTGQLLPVKEIGDLVKSKNIWFALDGAQVPGSMGTDVNDCKADFYTFSCHKWMLAPRRTGVLYVRKEIQDVLSPVTAGAYSDNGFSIKEGTLSFQPSAQRYEYGTQNELLFFGLHESLKFLNAIGIKKIREHNEALSERFFSDLKAIRGCELLSPAEKEYRSSMITFRIQGKDFNEITGAMGKDNIRVRPVSEGGLKGIRVSFHIYNNMDDVEKAVSSIRDFIKL
jgi:selenocysteine lyase/cysteine desulfurase